MHYAVEVLKARWELMLKAMGGYFETHWSVNPHWTAVFKFYLSIPSLAA